MLDFEKAHAILEHHFATVTPEEFVANVRRASPEFARELWGDRSIEDICSGYRPRARRGLRRLLPPFRRHGRRSPA